MVVLQLSPCLQERVRPHIQCASWSDLVQGGIRLLLQVRVLVVTSGLILRRTTMITLMCRWLKWFIFDGPVEHKENLCAFATVLVQFNFELVSDRDTNTPPSGDWHKKVLNIVCV